MGPPNDENKLKVDEKNKKTVPKNIQLKKDELKNKFEKT